jgi:peptidoglycan/LPS O-acetylase OafA/YrhL
MTSRNRQLDVLRAVAIMMVLSAHVVLIHTPRWWERPIVDHGWAGVDLFFVLSGYLISGLLFAEFQKTGGIRFKRFAFRRAMKIWPPLYALTSAVLAWRLYHDFSLKPVIPFVRDLLFLDSYLPGTYGHFWSLAVEEHFYILLPICLFLMLRAAPRSDNPFRAIPILFLIVASFALLTRIGAAIVTPAKAGVPIAVSFESFDYYAHFYPTHLRIDSLMFGVLLGYYDNFHGSRLRRAVRDRRLACLLASVLLLLPCFLLSQFSPVLYTVGFTSTYLGFGLLMLVFLETSLPERGPLAWMSRALARIGQYSYSIYLWHISVLLFCAEYIHLRPSVAWYFVGSIIVGIAMSKLIEIPTLRLRDRLSRQMFSA